MDIDSQNLPVLLSCHIFLADMVDDIRAPAAWRRPKTKIYDYNQDLGSAYYKVTSHQIIFYYGLLQLKAANQGCRKFETVRYNRDLSEGKADLPF